LAERRIDSLHGVGARAAERLAKLGLGSVQDLLFHLPLRYEDRTTVYPIGSLSPGSHVAIEAKVDLASIVNGRRRRLLCRVSDGTGHITLQFFHFYATQLNRLKPGARLQAFGEVRAVRGDLYMVHPDYRLLEEGESAVYQPEGLVPVYPTTQGLHQSVLRRLIGNALHLAKLPGALPDLLPPEIAQRFGLAPLLEALGYVHCPPADAPVHEIMAGSHHYVRRLALEELLAHHVAMRRLRQEVRGLARAPVLAGSGELRAEFLARLPFQLTRAQRSVDAEIAADMASDQAMLRLVQGDVGSGKTVVAALAALRAVECGWQAAVMAPTELLTEQHYRNFAGWLEPLGIRLVWLSGRLTGRRKARVLEDIALGCAQVVVGTHALFQEAVVFQRLGLVVVDEQHRFGVHQRLALREKGEQDGVQPHQLIMTATPIPRTLAMTAYADLDVSVIDELPPGRTPVTTVVVPDSRRDTVVERVHLACAEKRQVYWVCTLIEESEVLQAEAAAATAARLAEALPERRVGLLHGRMKPQDKEAVMHAFIAGEMDLLVATTVIEVGVDVPNASLMIIENAERLGLSQLHQLRGRVGRGAAASSCVLMYHGPLSDQAKTRLSVLRSTHDGFEVARRDLELRGPGEFLGTRQAGILHYRVADLTRDAHLLPEIQRMGEHLLGHYADRIDGLVQRWVGGAERYAKV
jgi:ATP-dependent DNA helicase RecG